MKKAARKAAPKKPSAKKPTVRKAAAKTTALVASSIFKTGDRAPTFVLKTQSGETVKLSDFKGQRVILYFYPKDDTPGCTKEACDLRDSFPELEKLKTVVLGVSRDSVVSHMKFKQKYELPFHLLADEEGKVCEAYGVWKEKSMYGRKYMGIERSTFIIDAQGKIEKTFPKVSVTGHVEELLEHLRTR